MPTKQALATEKRHARANEITEIDYQGNMTNDPQMIERAFVEYYESLLSHRARKEVGFEDDFLLFLPKISSEIRESLEEPISPTEVEKAIEELQTGK